MSSPLDKFGAISNYKIPPESTGTAIAHRRTYRAILTGVTFSDLRAGQVFSLSNGTTGVILTVAETGTTGETIAELSIDRQAGFEVISGSIVIDGSITGEVDRFREVFVPVASIVDGDSPSNSLKVSRTGSANVKFAQGDPYVDGFSNLRISSPKTLGSYSFFSSSVLNDFTIDTSGTGNVSIDPATASLNIDVGTASGDSAAVTTNNYHKYYKGFETIALVSGFSGDTGKAGVVRRWGIYDDNDGIYLEQDGTDLFAVLRSSASGTMQESRVHRDNWNGDHVDGSEGINNNSNFNLNIDANNLFTMAYSWLGSGSARIGMEGSSLGDITLHSFDEAHNQTPNAFLKNPNLPLRFETFNKTATSSPSRYCLICAAVQSSTNIVADREDGEGVLSSWFATTPKTITETPSVIAAARVGALNAEGLLNRKKIVPLQYSIHNPSDRPLLVEVRVGGETDGGTWNPTPSPRDTMEINSVATAIIGTDAIVQTDLLEPGINNIDVSSLFSSKGQYLGTGANGNLGTVLSFRARLLAGGTDTSSDVILSFNWIEV